MTPLALLGLLACSGSGGSSDTPAPPGAPTSAEAPQSEAAPVPPAGAQVGVLPTGVPQAAPQPGDPPREYALSDLTISLERTPCFGFCPAYRIDISGTGEVRWNGTSNVRVTGPATGSVSETGIAELLKAFYAVDFFRLRPRYDATTEVVVGEDGTVTAASMYITDLPSRVFTIRIGDYEKRVMDYVGAPPGVSALADLIDETVGADAWIGGAGQGGSGASGTVLVANMAENTVWLVDAGTGDRRATIQTKSAPHEVALSSDGGWAVVTNYGGQQAAGNLIQVIDVARGTVIRELVIEGHQRLHGAAVLQGDSLLALTSESTGEILIVSTRDGAVRRRLPTGGQVPHMLAVGGPWIAAANMMSGTVARVSPDDPAATRTWPAGVGNRTEGVGATPDGREIWTASMETGTVAGIDAETGEQLARITGLQVPYRLAGTPDGTRILVTDPEAQELVIIDRGSRTIEARVDIQDAAVGAGLGAATSPQGFFVGPDSRRAYIAVQGINSIAVVDIGAHEVIEFLPAGASPDGIAFSPVTAR